MLLFLSYKTHLLHTHRYSLGSITPNIDMSRNLIEFMKFDNLNIKITGIQLETKIFQEKKGF